MTQEQTNVMEIALQMEDVTVSLKGEQSAVWKLAKKLQTKATKTKKTSINGAPMDIVSEMVVTEVEDGINFKHPNYKSRTIAKAVLEEAEAKYEATGATSKNKTTGTAFVKVTVGDDVFPVGYNLIQAKNNAGL